MISLREYISIIFITLSSLAFSQAASDDCSNPTVVSDLDGTCNSYTYSGSTTNNGPWSPGCWDNNGGNPSELVYFSFTAQGANADITVSGIADVQIAVIELTGTDWCTTGDVNQLDCIATNNTSATLSTIDNFLVPGETYYIVVDFDATGTFDICVDNPTPPANDDCSNPTAISNLDGTCTTGTTVGAGPDAFVGSCWSTFNHSNGGATVWYSFVAQGNTADITVTGATAGSGPAITIYTSTDICDPGQTAQFDCADGGTTTESITDIYPLTEGDTYYIQVALDDDTQGNFDICVDNPVNDPGDNCLSAEPFCTDNTQTFDAATNTTAVDNADYGCLLSQPNPKWFYLEVDQAGDIDITMDNTNNNDIDYAIWGPVTDLSDGCTNDIVNNAPIDCSYSIAATETASITGASVGETYIMVITNYDNTPTTISFSQTGGSGSTDCGITLPVKLISFEGFSNEDHNLIEWETASENNNSHFILENSTDGETWQYLDKIPGSGTTFSNSFYEIRHAEPDNAINYYRLIQVDYNGKKEILGPIAVDNLQNVRIVKIVNLMGQRVDESYKGVVVIHYSNGRTVKRVQQ